MCRIRLRVRHLRPRLLRLADLLRRRARVHPLLLDVGLDVLAVLQAGRRQRRRGRPPLRRRGGRPVDAEVTGCREPRRRRRRRVHPAARRLLSRYGRRYARPPRVDGGQRQGVVVVVSFPFRAGEAVAAGEVLLVAGGHLVLDEADDVGEGERLLADAACQDVLVAVRLRPVCVCCNNDKS